MSLDLVNAVARRKCGRKEKCLPHNTVEGGLQMTALEGFLTAGNKQNMSSQGRQLEHNGQAKRVDLPRLQPESLQVKCNLGGSVLRVHDGAV
jgi:hypothetical protein